MEGDEILLGRGCGYWVYISYMESKVYAQMIISTGWYLVVLLGLNVQLAYI